MSTEIYVLNRDFELVGIVDRFESLIWRPSYSDMGDFELYMSTTEKAVELLKENYYLVRTQDISADSDDKIIYKKVMIIKNIKMNTDAENGDHLIITGKELKYILHQRLIWTQTNVSGTAEGAIRKFINQNAINPTDGKRKIPTLTLDAELGLTDEIEKQATAKPLDEVIVEICTTYNYGWDIYIYDNAFHFRLYVGTNRSYDQTTLPYVVFCDDYKNLNNSEYHKVTENYANVALVGGEGEGLERIYETVNGDISGLDRFETFVDASSVSSEEIENTASKHLIYAKRLREEGKTALAELEVSEAFTGETVNDGAFVYEEDYFLGDVVTVQNKYGVSKNVRIISAIECTDETGESLIPQFNF